MNREELIKEFDKQQLEILLNDLQDIDKFTGFKDGAFKYELGKYQANLLVGCIKKQKEVIDKAIEYIENNSLYEEEYDYDYEENSYLSGIDDETAKKDLLKILRGGINE